MIVVAALAPDLVSKLDDYAASNAQRLILVDDPHLHQTSKGNFGEVVSGEMMYRNHTFVAEKSNIEDADRGLGIDHIWIPEDTTHFDFIVTETKFITGFDGYRSRIHLGSTKSSRKFRDSWIAGMDFRNGKLRLEEAVGESYADQIQESMIANRVERLVIFVDEIGRT